MHVVTGLFFPIPREKFIGDAYLASSPEIFPKTFQNNSCVL